MKQITFIRNRWVLPLFGLLLTTFASCQDDDAKSYSPLELGAVKKSYEVPAIGSELAIQVYSNGQFNIGIEENQDWAKLDRTTMSGDGEFNVIIGDNMGFPRMVKVAVHSDNRADTVLIKQCGAYTPIIDLVNSSAVVSGKSGGMVVTPLVTNLELSDLKPKIVYNDEGDEWVSDMGLFNGNLVFMAQPNATDKLKRARIEFKYVDGWGAMMEETLYLTQSNSKDELGREVTFAEVRFQAGATIYDDIYIYGYVVSDNGNPNVADNPSLTGATMDREGNKKTAYIQDATGSCGLMLKSINAKNNVFKKDTKVQILLKGTTVTKEVDPDRYTISGIESMMVASSDKVAAIAPKERTVKTLTDDDIYTLVKLTDVEIPIREGCFTPINEGYGVEFIANRIDMYPLLIRGKDGGSMFLTTNLACRDYRRDGNPLPQGSGSITGIIVNEPFSRFEWNDAKQKGMSPSRYQIRNLSRADIALENSFDNSFSKLIVEWADASSVKIVGNKVVPTYGSGELYHSTINAANPGAISTYMDYRCLGPLKHPHPITPNAEHKGDLNDGGIRNPTWWDHNLGKGHSWVIKFSTAGIHTTQLSMQFTALNLSSGPPRYWVAEWSDHGNNDGVWNELKEYTVPDIALWSGTLLHQLPAYKNIDVTLPLEMLDKANVYVRLRVTANKGGTTTSYDAGTIPDVAQSAIGYVGIRYNK